jgi:hypothetical protein
MYLLKVSFKKKLRMDGSKGVNGTHIGCRSTEPTYVPMELVAEVRNLRTYAWNSYISRLQKHGIYVCTHGTHIGCRSTEPTYVRMRMSRFIISVESLHSKNIFHFWEVRNLRTYAWNSYRLQKHEIYVRTHGTHIGCWSTELTYVRMRMNRFIISVQSLHSKNIFHF